MVVSAAVQEVCERKPLSSTRVCKIYLKSVSLALKCIELSGANNPYIDKASVKVPAHMSLNFSKSRTRCLLLSRFVVLQPLSPVRSGQWRLPADTASSQLLTAVQTPQHREASGLGMRSCFPSTAMGGLGWVYRMVLRPLG